MFSDTENYTKFTVPLKYSSDLTPTSASIWISASLDTSKKSTLVTIGTVFYVDALFFSGVTRIKDHSQATSFSLEKNYPNPFNPTTTKIYSIPKAEQVTLKVYDILGNEVLTLVNKEQAAVSYKITFNSQSSNHKQLSSGIYFYRLETGKFTSIKKMLLLK